MVSLPVPFDALSVSPIDPTDQEFGVGSATADQLATGRYKFVPLEMRAARSWMVARGKIPHRVMPNSLQRGKVIVTALAKGQGHNNPEMHCSFEQAMQAINDDSSLELGFALGTGNDFACVDLDDIGKVVPEFQEAAAEQQRLIRERFVAATYSEISRSGKGWHFIGRCTNSPTTKASAKHPEYHIDLLFRSFLVVTGNHHSGTMEVSDISSELRSLVRWINGSDSEDKAFDLPTVGAITPANCDENTLRARLGGNWKHGEAYRDGRLAHDWSLAFSAILNSAAEITTDAEMVRRVVEQSGLVQLAEDKGNETRLAKFNRLWSVEWHKALERTELTRRANQTALAATKPLVLDDLWNQSAYVQFVVQERATLMITEGLIGGATAEEIAPLFRYLRPEKRNRLQDELRRVDEVFAQTISDAALLALSDTDTEVADLNSFINQAVADEAKIDRKQRFKQYNQQFYIVENYGGTAKVFRDEFHPVSGTQVYWSINAFCEAKNSDKILNGWELTKNEKVPRLGSAARSWVQSDKSRRYVSQELRFETTQREITVATGKVLNLFQGWSIAPIEGDWSNIRYLAHDILCSGFEQASEYLLNYVAHMVQRPQQLPGTAVILQSEEQGTGKSTFLSLLRQMLGARYCSVTSDANTLVGQFNVSAMNKVLLHFEEAIAPNDRGAESRIKALITNETLTYNAKGIAAIEARNFARVFLTSNARQVAHLSRFDRRWFVLNVSARHANDTRFWERAQSAYAGEIAAFMHAMRTRDISGFRPGEIPQTSAKDTQKMESVVGTDLVLRDLLEAGRLPPCSQNVGGVWEVRVSALTEYFKEHGIRVGYRHPQPGRVLKPVALGPASTRRLSSGGHASRSQRVISLPPLQVARQQFLDYLNIAANDWGDTGDTDWVLD
ncbi:hypothetical protein J7382_06790 [Shimia sp. R11_0]|uniref:DUF5906 domain-containing protein n=1 Tax=Shimia sp. R11_0 TaxID=2821096 RepID=UPI001ADD2F1D|nr:DUF5906 domain-containing protein [Shimia sp. R11_0]MBO9477235.1 hypothetical protein [Shimia sp. R11_0]